MLVTVLNTSTASNKMLFVVSIPEVDTRVTNTIHDTRCPKDRREVIPRNMKLVANNKSVIAKLMKMIRYVSVSLVHCWRHIINMMFNIIISKAKSPWNMKKVVVIFPEACVSETFCENDSLTTIVVSGMDKDLKRFFAKHQASPTLKLQLSFRIGFKQTAYTDWRFENPEMLRRNHTKSNMSKISMPLTVSLNKVQD